jgi:DNA polymerase-1
MRQLWGAAPGRTLVGVDATGIQLRILAHYINDEKFTKEVISGDVHSLNKQSLGEVCKDREVAKTFIYAWLLGAGVGKISEILSCSRGAAVEALDKFTNAYTGLKKLKEEIIPRDAARGYFVGLDGRLVKIWGDEESERRHLAMSGYLQNGEKCVMAIACILWNEKLTQEMVPYRQVDLVHDEFQTETINDLETALHIAEVQAQAIRDAGTLLNLNCPMDGSYKTKKGTYTIGQNWLITH